MRLFVFAPLALLSCTSTHTVTITVPPRESTAHVVIENEMSSYFALDRESATIDGKRALGLVSVAPGPHELVVDLDFHFVSHCIYCYVLAYKFHVHGRHAFTIGNGVALEIHAIAYEKGGVTTPIEQRPAMRFVEKVRP